MIKAVIFDIGNVLVKVNLSLWIEAFRNLGVENAEQLFHDKEVRDVIESSYGVGRMSTVELIDFFSLKATNQNAAFQHISFENFSAAWNSVILELFEDALETVRTLRNQGLKVFTLSDTNELHFSYIEALYQQEHPGTTFTALFDKCYLSHLTGKRKAQDEAWLEILEEQHLLAKECLFVDDLKHNIERADNLKINVFHYQPRNTMAEVVAKIKGINQESKETDDTEKSLISTRRSII